jgi:endonuclease/exonuclease/phosphatase family metal-dependent hydrolase
MIGHRAHRWQPLRRAAAAFPLAAAAVAACAPATSATSAGGVPAAAEAPAPMPLRVMTFNIRYDTPADSGNAWPHRRDWVASLVRFHGADALGVQEALAHMLRELDVRLPGYARVGVGRTDGREEGEFSAILYRTDRLELLDSGTFWLSPTPDVPGSKGWDAAYERVATWARFRDRRTGCRHLHVNTHFDHIGERAREESARLIRRRLGGLAGGLPVVVTGDLNTTPERAPYRVFTVDTVGGVPPLRDAFVASRGGHYGPTSTWNAFTAIEPGQRIDYVLVSADVDVLEHAILPDAWDGRFPSDHLPVVADIAVRCR